MLLTTSASAQTITTSQVPGSSHTTAADINDAGSITGDFSDGSGRHGFIRDSDGSFTEFNVPGATTTFPLRINAAETGTRNIRKPGFPAVIVGFVLDRKGADAEKIIEAVKQCPSGALGYSVDGVEQRDGDSDPMILVVPNGPYAVRGGAELEQTAWGEGASREHFTLCRWGQSTNKPFCNGAHWNHRFDEHA